MIQATIVTLCKMFGNGLLQKSEKCIGCQEQKHTMWMALLWKRNVFKPQESSVSNVSSLINFQTPLIQEIKIKFLLQYCHRFMTRHSVQIHNWIHWYVLLLITDNYNIFIIRHNLQITTSHLLKSFWTAVSSHTHCLVMASNNRDSNISMLNSSGSGSHWLSLYSFFSDQLLCVYSLPCKYLLTHHCLAMDSFLTVPLL
jgi:hypothetical protein